MAGQGYVAVAEMGFRLGSSSRQNPGSSRRGPQQPLLFLAIDILKALELFPPIPGSNLVLGPLHTEMTITTSTAVKWDLSCVFQKQAHFSITAASGPSVGNVVMRRDDRQGDGQFVLSSCGVRQRAVLGGLDRSWVGLSFVHVCFLPYVPTLPT